MTPGEVIREFAKRAKSRQLRFLEDSLDAVTVDPEHEGSFPVGLVVDGDAVVVTGGAWHEHFSDCEEGMECAAFLLSDACRLKTVYRGNVVVSCTVQSLEDGHWVDGPMVGFFFFPFWKPKRVEYSQNKVIETND